MPLFEYRCSCCLHEFDEIADRDAPPPPCEECGKPTRRLMSAGTKYRFKVGDFFEPFVTPHITGEDVLVTSREHEQRLCREHNVKPVAGHASIK